MDSPVWLISVVLVSGMLQSVGHSLRRLKTGIFILWVVGVKCGLAFIRASGHPSGRWWWILMVCLWTSRHISHFLLCVHLCIVVCVCVCICLVSVCVSVCVHVCTYMCTCVCVCVVCVYICIYIYVCMCVQWTFTKIYPTSSFLFMYLTVCSHPFNKMKTVEHISYPKNSISKFQLSVYWCADELGAVTITLL